jgi:hypothetical protein
MSALGEAALAYARHGWPVFPLQPRGKDPHGYQNATRDPDTVKRWWAQCPEANIGVATGRGIGAWVLDLDCKNGARGLDTYEDLRGEPAIRETLQQITGSGGKQLFFTLPGFDVPCFGQKRTATVGLEGCDIKGEGGYVAVPPSIHPDTAREYAWDGIEEFDQQPILDTPPVLLKALAKLIDAPDSNRKVVPMVGAITEGQRNDTLFRIACSLRGKGLSEAAIRAALIEENRARCSPALPDDEVRRIAASASKYEPGADTAPEPQRGLSAVGIDVSAVRTPAEALAVLNTLTLWKGRIRWQAFRRRGSQIEGQTEDGAAVRFAADRILTFAYARAQVYAATDVAILEPKRGKINATWAEACELISHAARADAVQCGNPEDDLAADLRRVFELSGKPRPRDSDELFRLLVNLKTYRREPHADKAPPCVFVWKARTWCHLPVLRLWLGTPAGLARHATLPVLGEQLALLGFQRAQDLEVERGDKRVRVDAWSGPADFVEAAEAGETGE